CSGSYFCLKCAFYPIFRLVKEVVARLSDPAQSGRSIGIVTFSQAQQSLIEDLLDVARNDNPGIETFFTDEVPEPVFVKNLENVQGDERDVIFFSICYAKDHVGRLSMNFGPLNRDGGERRLNVAITRAREEVVVFSSIRAEDIDLSRTKSLGVTHLKSYLKYAENGIQTFGNISESPVATDDFESAFEKEVAEFLTSAGYPPHTQVGCSGYRIDLAVPHPDKPGLYILGIECDGAAYHSSATAKDRDQLRQSVLENLGWKIHRVWSTAWWHRPKKTKAKLLEAVKDALYEAENRGEDSHLGRTNAENNASSSMKFEDLVEEIESETKAPKSMEDHALSVEYPSIQYPEFSTSTANTEAFMSLRYRPKIMAQIEAVISREAPICRNVLYRRVADLWGIKRVTEKIRKVFEDALSSNLSHGVVVDENDVFWSKLKQSGDYQHFRYSSKNEDYRRLLDEIPIEEIANAMYYVMCEYHSCKADALYRETAAVFGVARVTKKSEDFLKAALQNLKERELIE
ncbi:MAG: DUF3320 domain-containing protein, partial [Lentisphaeria bacterium]|nr:DUF3320 domain-containing protein [Lentisphaeria bacterium]